MEPPTEHHAAIVDAIDSGDRAGMDREFARDPDLALTQLEVRLRQWSLAAHEADRDPQDRAQAMARLDSRLAWDREYRSQLGFEQSAVNVMSIAHWFGGGAVTLVCGAGVSRAAGLPDWKELVLLCLDFAIRNASAKDVDRLRGIREQLRANPEYTSAQLLDASRAVHESVDGGARRVVRETLDPYIKPRAARNVFASPLHQAISELTPARMAPKPGLLSVVTYNFDDLLESALLGANQEFTVVAGRDVDWHIKNWYRADLGPGEGLAIFHPHGFLGDWAMPEDLDFVFTQAAYDDGYRDGTFAATSTELSLSTVCLFIGTSFLDDYVRQFLQRQNRPGWWHYAFLCYQGRQGQELERWFQWESERLEPLGIRVCGYPDHKVLPGYLELLGDS